MTLEMLLLSLIAGGILVAQLLCLRHHSALVGIIKAHEPHFTDITTNFSDVGDGINESLMEMIRIGSDVADQIDNLSVGGGVVSSPALSPQMDIQGTIMSLIADKVLGGFDGTKPSRTISSEEENGTTPESISE